MIKISEIRKYMGIWSQQTYSTGLTYCYSIKKDKSVYDLTFEVLKKQKLDEKKMDGFSVQKIPYIDEGKTEVIFTDIFWKIAEEYITPAYYIATIVKECINKGLAEEKVISTVGRGLRAFPSFLREMDLTCKIAQFFPEAEIRNGPEQDIGEHTDIFIKSKENTYRLWSYQNFERGLDNTAQRFYGKRGEVPKGYHVLCPIDIGSQTETEEINGWIFYSERYVRYLFEMISIEKPDDYFVVRRLGEYALKMYLSKAKIVKK